MFPSLLFRRLIVAGALILGASWILKERSQMPDMKRIRRALLGNSRRTVQTRMGVPHAVAGDDDIQRSSIWYYPMRDPGHHAIAVHFSSSGRVARTELIRAPRHAMAV